MQIGSWLKKKFHYIPEVNTIINVFSNQFQKFVIPRKILQKPSFFYWKSISWTDIYFQKKLFHLVTGWFVFVWLASPFEFVKLRMQTFASSDRGGVRLVNCERSGLPYTQYLYVKNEKGVGGRSEIVFYQFESMHPPPPALFTDMLQPSITTVHWCFFFEMVHRFCCNMNASMNEHCLIFSSWMYFSNCFREIVLPLCYKCIKKTLFPLWLFVWWFVGINFGYCREKYCVWLAIRE